MMSLGAAVPLALCEVVFLAVLFCLTFFLEGPSKLGSFLAKTYNFSIAPNGSKFARRTGEKALAEVFKLHA